MLKIAFYINAAIEILAGLVFTFKPDLLPSFSGATEAILLARMYGAAALAMGVGTLLAASKLDNKGLIQVVLSMLVIFHVGVAIANWLYAPDMAGAILHTVLGTLFLFLYVKER